ncbi:hypothetical protein LSH36_120g06033 [Paralvinella palmiformis]|uniref:Nucleotide-diphospho-sugar transferase domain-containing protein n=1 Tax=Paralvinella palmiformis TaxID=53620 RepID=A0AAD9JYC4_9ANNE|nr:hypothetical protein LSH36_120g06033 [Paralvinella palmiformis]
MVNRQDKTTVQHRRHESGFVGNMDMYDQAIRNASGDSGVVILVLCRDLELLPVGCYVYRVQIPKSGSASTYDTHSFIEKMNIRVDMITDALRLGHTVLHTDVDVTFFEDPIPLIESACAPDDCQMAAMLDVDVYNAGFIFLRPRPEVLLLYRRLRHLCRYKRKDDQTCLNDVIQRMTDDVRVVGLSTEAFRSGVEHFENGRAEFGDNKRSPGCVVVHNNWLVGKEAKVYRYQENGFWAIDFVTTSTKTMTNYYSDKNNRYLTFDLPPKESYRKDSLPTQAETLRNALILGHILGRIVILPKFLCSDSTVGTYYCNVLHVVDFSSFHRFFGGFYREHRFLDHRLVPDSVRSDRETYEVSFVDRRPGAGDDGILYVPVRGWNGTGSSVRSSVVYLTGVNNTLPEAVLDDDSLRRISDNFHLAIRIGNYRQYQHRIVST